VNVNAADARPYGDSICWRCVHHCAIDGARSVFVMCTALPVRYPRQPVVTCEAFDPGAPSN
jgi:hypothetical protein